MAVSMKATAGVKVFASAQAKPAKAAAAAAAPKKCAPEGLHNCRALARLARPRAAGAQRAAAGRRSAERAAERAVASLLASSGLEAWGLPLSKTLPACRLMPT